MSWKRIIKTRSPLPTKNWNTGAFRANSSPVGRSLFCVFGFSFFFLFFLSKEVSFDHHHLPASISSLLPAICSNLSSNLSPHYLYIYVSRWLLPYKIWLPSPIIVKIQSPKWFWIKTSEKWKPSLFLFAFVFFFFFCLFYWVNHGWLLLYRQGQWLK